MADLRELQLLTAKPFLYVFNMDISELADAGLRKRLSALVAPAEAIFLDAKTEADLAELPEDEAAELLAEAGLGEPGLAQLARAGFRALGLQTFLTAGPKETRAWEIKAGATAPEAAGVIHTDFQRGFIKAEVVSFGDLIAAFWVPAALGCGQGPHRRQGLRHARRRRRGVPPQRNITIQLDQALALARHGRNGHSRIRSRSVRRSRSASRAAAEAMAPMSRGLKLRIAFLVALFDGLLPSPLSHLRVSAIEPEPPGSFVGLLRSARGRIGRATAAQRRWGRVRRARPGQGRKPQPHKAGPTGI